MDKKTQNKLTQLEGKRDELSELGKAVLNFKSDLQYHIENQNILVEIRRATFDAYLKQGFNQEQALELLKSEIEVG